MNIIELKGNAILTSEYDLVVCNSSVALTLTLKSAGGNKNMFYVKNIGSADVTITANLPDLIDGSATKVLTQYESCIVLDYKLNNWIVI